MPYLYGKEFFNDLFCICNEAEDDGSLGKAITDKACALYKLACCVGGRSGPYAGELTVQADGSGPLWVGVHQFMILDRDASRVCIWMLLRLGDALARMDAGTPVVHFDEPDGVGMLSLSFFFRSRGGSQAQQKEWLRGGFKKVKATMAQLWKIYNGT